MSPQLSSLSLQSRTEAAHFAMCWNIFPHQKSSLLSSTPLSQGSFLLQRPETTAPTKMCFPLSSAAQHFSHTSRHLASCTSKLGCSYQLYQPNQRGNLCPQTSSFLLMAFNVFHKNPFRFSKTFFLPQPKPAQKYTTKKSQNSLIYFFWKDKTHLEFCEAVCPISTC